MALAPEMDMANFAKIARSPPGLWQDCDKAGTSARLRQPNGPCAKMNMAKFAKTDKVAGSCAKMGTIQQGGHNYEDRVCTGWQ
jgi:hypothetical protein